MGWPRHIGDTRTVEEREGQLRYPPIRGANYETAAY